MEMEDYSIAETKNSRSTVTPKLPLPLLKKAPMKMMIHYSGCMGTPPHHTLASIPFQWEEQPGKPRACTTIVPFLPNTNNLLDQPRKCLELPPRLLGQKFKPSSSSSSPVAVLDGPYYMGRLKFISSSFRLAPQRQGVSFEFDSSGPDEEEREEEENVERKINLQKIRRGIFGLTWKRKNSSSNLLKRGGRNEAGSISFGYVSSSSSSMEEKTSSFNGSRWISNVNKNASSSSSGVVNNISQTGSHFWAAMYEGFKQVIPWKSRKI